MDNFEEHLMAKYPNLFPKDKDGKTTYADCGVSCPEGWELLVENLCGSIDFRLKHQFNRRQINKIRFFFWRLIWNRLRINGILNKLEESLDPVDWSKSRCMLSSKVTEIRSAFPKRNKMREKVLSFRNKISPRQKYKLSPLPQVIIGQIKQKIDLRFYYSGGDEVVRGMVSFAEKMSRSICEETGQRGFPCNRGGWMRTLSEEKMKELGYKTTKL